MFFGRDTQVLRALDRLRLMRDAGAERALVVLGASGAGKSSFLEAGLWPRLRRMTFASFSKLSSRKSAGTSQFSSPIAAPRWPATNTRFASSR
ncbi:hypothetical protein [Mesorhizobium sp.]|uniref:nSTAND1 domain-containing NTPase n=1 Tax=Mesorhizobium sp. TaxID=1871066 RepID=UPI00338D382A